MHNNTQTYDNNKAAEASILLRRFQIFFFFYFIKSHWLLYFFQNLSKREEVDTIIFYRDFLSDYVQYVCNNRELLNWQGKFSFLLYRDAEETIILCKTNFNGVILRG